MVPIVPMSKVPMVPVFAKEPSNVVKELSMVSKEASKVAKEATKVAKEPSKVAKEPSKVTKEPSTVAKEPAMSPWAKRCNFYSYDGRKDVTFSEKLGEITSQT